ncbi:MAG TPA: hypothetical protein VJ896_00665 [Bacteroidales bacterium]|nr:hypothetical protein [Bacteroidales bacterium]
MKKLIFISLILVMFFSCSDEEENNNLYSDVNFKQEMRDFVTDISQYAKAKNPNFVIIPQKRQIIVMLQA